jgi:Skp family chaperone for outer membrane proteins
MKKFLTIFSGIILGSFVMMSVALAADKFAYIDLSRTFSEYYKTKDYDKALTAKEDNYISERDKKLNEFNSLKDKFSLLSDKEKESKKSELETKAKTLKDYVTQKESDLRKEQEDKMKEILQDIEGVVKTYSEKEGYTMVFNDRVLVYQNKTMDITDKIIAILNKGKK